MSEGDGGPGSRNGWAANDTSLKCADTLRFGSFELEPETGELRKDGRPVKLRHQPSRVLVLLASHAGRLVTREEIQKSLWASTTHVDFEQGLNYCIRDIRSALGDTSGEPRFVETLPRRGYRFIAPVAARPGAQPPPAATTDASRRRWLRKAGLGCLTLGLVGLATWLALRGANESASQRLTVAILPFDDLSEGAVPASFAEGLTEELVAQIGRLHPGRLSVIARLSAREFGEEGRPIEALGRELGVHFALEGSVRQSSGRVIVTARLVRVSDSRQVWSETFETDRGDAVELQRLLARATAAGVHLTLDPDHRAGPAQPVRMDPEAYRLYAQGWTLWNSWTPSSLRASVDRFADAIRIVPDYAPAHAALANASIALADQGQTPSDGLLRQAKEASVRALELDGSLAEAHAAYGMVLATQAFDWSAAEEEFKRAIVLNPGCVPARYWYTHVLRAAGRLDEALIQSRTAEGLAPASPVIRYGVAMVQMQRGELTEAVQRFRSLIASKPGFPAAYLGLGRALLIQRQFPEALRSLERAAELSGRSARYQAALAHAYAVSGRPLDARRIVERLEHEPLALAAYDVAIASAGLADYDRAVLSLQRAIQAKDPAARNVLADERLRPLHADPRWRALTQSVGLAGEPKPASLRFR